MHTPPFPVLLTAVPAEAAADLAAKTLNGRPIAGVNSYEEPARAFAAAWRERTAGQVDVHRRMRLYRLAELSWPDPVPEGAPRPARGGDVALLAEWFSAFVREVDDMGDDRSGGRRQGQDQLRRAHGVGGRRHAGDDGGCHPAGRGHGACRSCLHAA